MNDLRRGMVTAALIVTLAALVLVSLACCGTREFFDRIDGFTPTPAPDTCVPDCVALCEQIQAKHGNPPEVCAADCRAVCEEAEEGK